MISITTDDCPLFQGLDKELLVWMSHGDQLSKLPEGFTTVASTSTAPFAAVQKLHERIFGMQFHPEVTHTPQGKQILKNFVLNICGAQANWTMVLFHIPF
jgi:GMP synthase (glutamine-hydrolysing)